MFSSLANGILVVNTKNELKVGEGEGSVTPKKNDIRPSGPVKEEWSSHMVYKLFIPFSVSICSFALCYFSKSGVYLRELCFLCNIINSPWNSTSFFLFPVSVLLHILNNVTLNFQIFETSLRWGDQIRWR